MKTSTKKLKVNSLWGTLKLQKHIATMMHKIKEGAMPMNLPGC